MGLTFGDGRSTFLCIQDTIVKQLLAVIQTICLLIEMYT